MVKYFFVVFFMGMKTWSWAQATLNAKFEQEIEKLIQHTIPTITCDRLKAKFQAPNLVVLDAREKKEFAVSHLEGAQWIGYQKFDKKRLRNIDKEAIVVVYCSVGYRSERIAEQLKKIGYHKVYNLYGGIFEWVNRSYPLVDSKGKKTQNVHAYNKDWGRWLEQGNKVYSFK